MYILCILINCDFLDRNGLQLLQYSISKHGDWLIVFFGLFWARTKYTRFLSKHLWHFPMDVLVKYIFLLESDKSSWCYDEQNNRKKL